MIAIVRAALRAAARIESLALIATVTAAVTSTIGTAVTATLVPTLETGAFIAPAVACGWALLARAAASGAALIAAALGRRAVATRAVKTGSLGRAAGPVLLAAALLELGLALLAFGLGSLEALARARHTLAADRRAPFAIGIAFVAGTGRACSLLVEFQSGHGASGFPSKRKERSWAAQPKGLSAHAGKGRRARAC